MYALKHQNFTAQPRVLGGNRECRGRRKPIRSKGSNCPCVRSSRATTNPFHERKNQKSAITPHVHRVCLLGLVPFNRSPMHDRHRLYRRTPTYCCTYRRRLAFTYGPCPRRMPGTMGNSLAGAASGRAGMLVAHLVDMVETMVRMIPERL